MRLSIIVILLLSVNTLPGQGDWTLVKEETGIKVFTRNVPGYSMKAFRGIMEIPVHQAETIVKILQDVNHLPEWSPITSSAKILKSTGNQERIVYVTTEAPWPVRDRDGIYRFALTRSNNKVVTLKVSAIPNYLPAKKGFVRVPKSEGYWKLKPIDQQRVQVIYENHSDPGGSIPAWLANSSVVNIPLKSLQNLRKRLDTAP